MHGVNLQRLAASVVRRSLSSWHATMRPEDLEDAIQHLWLEAWQLAEQFDPGYGDENIGFDGYAGRILRRRFIDYMRRAYVDTRYESHRDTGHAVRFATSLDAPAGLDSDVTLGEILPAPEPGRELLAQLADAVAGNGATDCSPALARLLRARDRGDARDLRVLRQAFGTKTERASAA